jgi:hypothetical protein
MNCTKIPCLGSFKIYTDADILRFSLSIFQLCGCTILSQLWQARETVWIMSVWNEGSYFFGTNTEMITAIHTGKIFFAAFFQFVLQFNAYVLALPGGTITMQMICALEHFSRFCSRGSYTGAVVCLHPWLVKCLCNMSLHTEVGLHTELVKCLCNMSRVLASMVSQMPMLSYNMQMLPFLN